MSHPGVGILGRNVKGHDSHVSQYGYYRPCMFFPGLWHLARTRPSTLTRTVYVEQASTALSVAAFKHGQSRSAPAMCKAMVT